MEDEAKKVAPGQHKKTDEKHEREAKRYKEQDEND